MSRKHGLFLHKQANQNGSLASSHEHSWTLRRKRIKKSKKKNCFWIRFLLWMVLSHLQKFICTSLDLWWMVEGVKDKTERANKDHELIWIFYTWVDFFFSNTVNLSSNVDCDELQTLLGVLLIAVDWKVMWRCWEGKDLWSWAGQNGKDQHQHLAGNHKAAQQQKPWSVLSSPDTAAHKFSFRFHKHWRLFGNSLVRITNADCTL